MEQGFCELYGSLLETHGITEEDMLPFWNGATFISLAPAPGHPDLVASWSCDGELESLYRRTSSGFRQLHDLAPYAPALRLRIETDL